LRRYNDAKITRNNHAIRRAQNKAADLSGRFLSGRSHCHTISRATDSTRTCPNLHYERQSCPVFPDVSPTGGRPALFLRYSKLTRGERKEPQVVSTHFRPRSCSEVTPEETLIFDCFSRRCAVAGLMHLPGTGRSQISRA